MLTDNSDIPINIKHMADMRSQSLAVLFVFTTLAVLSVRCQDEVDYSDKLFADYKVYELGLPAVLHCNNTSQQSTFRPNTTSNSTPTAWMLNLSNSLSRIELSEGKYEISDNNWTLTIWNTSKEDFGQYHCMLMSTDGEWYLITVGLNVEGPYFEDLWKKYDTPTMIAFCALGGFLLLTAVVVLLYVFRYQSDDDHDSSSSSSYASLIDTVGVTPMSASGVYNSAGVMVNGLSEKTVDNQSKSSKRSGHGSKRDDKSKKASVASHSDKSVEKRSVGKDNKAFEMNEMEESKRSEGKIQAEVHSSDSSALDSSLDEDKEFTSM